MKRPTAIKTVIALAATLAASAAWPQQPFDLDTTFRFNAGSVYIRNILPLSDGDVIVSGQIAIPGEWPYERLGAKLHSDGSLDPLFRTYPSMGGKITPWQDQYYCGVGQVVRRFFMDGRIDSSYLAISDAPYCSMGQGGDYYVFPDGRVLVSGSHYLQDSIRGFMGEYGLIWFTNQGYLDTTRIHRRSNGSIFNIFPLPTGKFLCGGLAWSFDGYSLPSTTFRVLPDGALDTTFQAPAGFINTRAACVQPDGKILIGGDPFYLDNGDTVNLMRLMLNGSMDTSFHNPMLRTYNPIIEGYQGSTITSITPLDDNKFIITGGFTEFDGEMRGGIALIDTAGHLLSDHFTGQGCGGYQWADIDEYWAWSTGFYGITQVSDGSYYIYGGYHGYDDGSGTDGSSQRLISRLYGLNVGIKENGTNTNTPLSIAPNPSNGGAVQLSVGCVPKHATLSIHDASGRVVRQEPWPAGTYTHTLRAGLLAPGTYLLRLQEEAGSLYSGKLIILP